MIGGSQILIPCQSGISMGCSSMAGTMDGQLTCCSIKVRQKRSVHVVKKLYYRGCPSTCINNCKSIFFSERAGFTNLMDYYRENSCKDYLKNVC